MFNKIWIAAAGAFGTALLAALGIDIYEHHQVSKKVGLASGELKNASIKDIQQGIIEKAVKDAADEKVTTYIRGVREAVMSEARCELDKEVRKAVKEANEAIQKEVSEKVSTEASLIDMAEMKKSVRNRAEEKILSKFDGDLDDLLVKYNDQLSNVQKIYRGIADAIGKDKSDEGKGLKFTIG